MSQNYFRRQVTSNRRKSTTLPVFLQGDENINNRRLSIYLNGQHRLYTLSQIFLPHGGGYHAQEHLLSTSSESHQSFVLMTVEDDRNGEGERRLSIICGLYHPIDEETFQ
ncbi:unnamed protein product [Rotaria sordida]|uniref:Uncharacterized protein n=1 Tax=Rotaria sordida TaxID=392033 RepID=A0A814TER3_9BILA|nr:unnamed protein product [Rotaria sordida]CAF1628192.1 unnamed protein product [Rotaria sordida]